MRHALIVVTLIAGFASPLRAQQGADFPAPGSDRGANFPKSVSPTATNPTNWVAPQVQYTDPNAGNPRWNRWNNRRQRLYRNCPGC